MKHLLCFLAVITTLLQGQTYEAYNITLVSKLTPNVADHGFDGRKYSGCWGWFQSSRNKEYAISGTSNGTYFIDITSPATPTVCAFVQGKQGCTYREMKTYQNYCYIISDDGEPTGLQIVDLQYLPDSVRIIYNGPDYFKRAHSLWIDGSKMYLGSATYSTGFSSMAVYSIATPTAPVLLRKLEQDFPFIGLVHDMHSRNDTIYASAANQGLFVFRYDNVTGTFKQLGSYTGYPQAGYNHSSFLTDDGKHLVFCDEIPSGLPIRLVNVENLSNIQAVKEFIPHARTTPHNPFIRDKFAVVACYEDGLYIYDLSDPASPSRAGFFDTHPQGGANTGTYAPINYRGNWGAYPFLPSKLIIANDMQNGVFILDATAAYTTTVKDPVGLANASQKQGFNIYPTISNSEVSIGSENKERFDVTLRDASGRLISFYPECEKTTTINVNDLAEGLYFISVDDGAHRRSQKLIIQK